MNGDGLYLTTYECALAVVATSMKKARLPLDVLVVNSFIGGILFTSGGMLHVMIQSECPQIMESNPGIIALVQGCLYPIGLFYVVVMGVDLFNSNILFFTVGVARGAVTILDLLISWLVSWWLNLVGTIFVCYIICHFSGVSSSATWVAGSVAILDRKLEFSFVETLLKAMAGEFFVCLAIYLQLMAKPIHVKFLLMLLPVLTFVSLGYTHSVADMFMIIIGLINGTHTTVATVAWKLFLPGALGNIIGGGFFSLIVPFYLHILAVERDQRKLNLPRFEMRDQQPEINQDSRVVRAREEEEDELEGKESEAEGKEKPAETPLHASESAHDRTSLQSVRSAGGRKFSMIRSPSNVFPVYGMGRPGERERSIASGVAGESSNVPSTSSEQPEYEHRKSATFLGKSLYQTLSRNQSKRDAEARETPMSPVASSRNYPRGPAIFKTPRDVAEGNGYFMRSRSDSTRHRNTSDISLPIPPEASVENSPSDSATPSVTSALDVKAYDPADHV